MTKKVDNRKRNFETIVYPDSCPDNWIDILKTHKVPAFISPLHNLDKDSDGKLKKAHWHVMIMFDGLKTIEQAKEVFDSIGGVGLEIVKSIRGSTRYLCHLDNDDKVKYPVEDVIQLFGADFHSVSALPSDTYSVIGEIIDFCVDNNIKSFAEIFLYARECNFTWFKVLCDKSYSIEKFLKSLSWTENTNSWSNDNNNYK